MGSRLPSPGAGEGAGGWGRPPLALAVRRRAARLVLPRDDGLVLERVAVLVALVRERVDRLVRVGHGVAGLAAGNGLDAVAGEIVGGHGPSSCGRARRRG